MPAQSAVGLIHGFETSPKRSGIYRVWTDGHNILERAFYAYYSKEDNKWYYANGTEVKIACWLERKW